jgi:hypothetical protein
VSLADEVPLIVPYGQAPALARPTTDRRIFRVAGQPWRYKGVTAFMLGELLRQGADILPFVRLYTGLGFNTFRVLANKPPAGSYPSWVTPPLEVALALNAVLAAEGAYVEWVLAGSQIDVSFVPAWITAFRDQCPNVFVEGINEPGHDQQFQTTDPVDALVQPVRGDLPYATGDYTYDATKPRGTYGTIHTDRADDPYETARKAKGVLDMQDIASIAWVGDEPGKPQDLGYKADAFLALFAIYGLLGAGGTFHTLGGQFGQLPDDNELACAKAAAAGLDAFPASTPIDYGYAHDTNDEAATGSLRTYRAGPYGVRVRPQNGAPILMGV